MISMLLMIVVMFAILPFRAIIGQYMHFVLNPLIGFNGLYPVLTIFCAGILLIVFTTLIRHFTTDWKAQAKSQQISKAFSKEMREAQMDRDVKRMEKLRKQQQEIMSMSMAQSSKQMKLMPITMVIAISIFFWLWHFLGVIADANGGVVNVVAPWNPEWNLLGSSFWFPNFIWIYMFVSMPLGQVFTKVLQFFTMKRARESEEYIINERL
jgi:uncharacterized membrane protein (DUF106 family)